MVIWVRVDGRDRADPVDSTAIQDPRVLSDLKVLLEHQDQWDPLELQGHRGHRGRKGHLGRLDPPELTGRKGHLGHKDLLDLMETKVRLDQ